MEREEARKKARLKFLKINFVDFFFLICIHFNILFILNYFFSVHFVIPFYVSFFNIIEYFYFLILSSRLFLGFSTFFLLVIFS